ncbi:MAG: exodeoxyribonuclease V subunit beta [Chromatiales bacterium]|nr:exodeoxyribonuclease V subunit beta [Chromatiales bacterium]
MEQLDLLEAPLQGINLIEAGAGTGKTYTIAGLFLRLVLEAELAVENVLVVTYTKAATAELRERIRAQLVKGQIAFQNGASDDPLISALLDRAEDPQRWQRLLQRAVLDFDRAAIFTIHGFCQRALADSAFESSAPFRAEMLLDEQSLLQEIVDDFWRIEIQDANSDLANYLLEQCVTADNLTGFLRGKLAKPYLEVRGVEQESDLQSVERAFEEAFLKAKSLWSENAEEISTLLRTAPGLLRTKYRKDHLENWITKLNEYLAGDAQAPFAQLERFTPGFMVGALKKGGEPPEHSFFERCEQLWLAWHARVEAYRQCYVGLQQRLLSYADSELQRRKAAQRLLGYDDLLLNLDQALEADESGYLVQSLRQQYRAALIDEFQDTDPVQYRIFSQIYSGVKAPVYLVGDPKQAIYSFRGADIFAYLQAREQVDNSYTLVTNWRSDPELIEAVNTLFNQQTSFLFSQITYHEAKAAERERAVLSDPLGERGALCINYIPSEPKSAPLNKEAAANLAAADSANEIARLLSGEVTLDGRLLAAGDIAVLVRSHHQGELMRQALHSRGIHSVQRSPGNVFHSWEAQELERLLQAIIQPGREALLKAALATDLLGGTSGDIERLAHDDLLLEQRQVLFVTSNRQWREQGFMPMFRHLLRSEAIAPRLLELENGERRLTNLFHLGELLHRYERDSGGSMGRLLSWLAQQRQSERAEDEEHQIRLESDENLVQIVTVHKSKGLQYPVVFVPFAWDGGLKSGQRDGTYQFHDPADRFRPVLELGSANYEADLPHAQREEMAEHLRLLYVALTRAKHRCYLHWGSVSGAEQSAFAWLLAPPDDEGIDPVLHGKNIKKYIKDNVLLDKIHAISRNMGEMISIRQLDPEQALVAHTLPEEAAAGVDQSLRAKTLQRRSLSYANVTSFSALFHHPGGYQAEDGELPDYDQLASARPVEESEQDESPTIFTFPKGALAGSCLHGIFEEIDFTQADQPQVEEVVAGKLQEYGFTETWQPVVVSMVRRVLATALDETGLTLAQITNRQKLVELPFYYPLGRINSRDLVDILRRYGYADTPVLERAVQQLAFTDVSGYMKGFIDLVFEHQGRFYLLDYKSNWLGNHLEEYDQPALAEAIARERYFLQYLVYAVALHRYLQQRLPDYHYDRHIGGVLYLFLRGMSPETGAKFGVFRDRPSSELINELDRYFASEGAAV